MCLFYKTSHTHILATWLLWNTTLVYSFSFMWSAKVLRGFFCGFAAVSKFFLVFFCSWQQTRVGCWKYGESVFPGRSYGEEIWLTGVYRCVGYTCLKFSWSILFHRCGVYKGWDILVKIWYSERNVNLFRNIICIHQSCDVLIERELVFLSEQHHKVSYNSDGDSSRCFFFRSMYEDSSLCPCWRKHKQSMMIIIHDCVYSNFKLVFT